MYVVNKFVTTMLSTAAASHLNNNLFILLNVYYARSVTLENQTNLYILRVLLHQ